MKAIRTRYHGPTNTKGSRISARADGKHCVVLSYDYALNIDKNHEKAARELCNKLDWGWEFVSGGFGGDYYHVFIE